MLGGKINFEKLSIFRMLCNYQSFSLVAKKLNINQSMVSRYIKDLERLMKKKLIANSYKPIELTRAGKKLFDMTKTMDFQTDHMQENLLMQNKNATYPQIKILISISMSLGCLIAERIKHILNRYPEILLDIKFTNEITLEILNQRDIIIMKKPYDHMLIENHFMEEYEMVFGVSRNYMKRHGYPKFVSSLPQHRFIFIQDYDYPSIITENMRKNMSRQYLIDNELCAIKAVQSDCGVGIMPKFITKDFPDIITFELDEKLGKFGLNIAISKVKKNSYIDLVIDFFKNNIKL